MDKVVVKYIDIDSIEKNFDMVISLIDNDRLIKAQRYRQKSDQLLSLGAGYLIKKYLGAYYQKTNQNGKIYLQNGPFFNISHSGKYVVLAISENKEVGVDIQLIDEKDLKTIEHVSNEHKTLDEMFQIWTNKESLIKCLGENISFIKSIPGLPITGKRTFRNDSFYTQSLLFDGYALSITLKGEEPFEIILEKCLLN